MTEVAFHFNLPDKLNYACRLLRKAVNTGMKVVVTAPVSLLQQLDTALWTFSSLDFVPHCFQDGDREMAAASSVVLAEATDSSPHQQILLNLGQVVPDGFARFERLIEVVGPDEVDREAARQRWKHYADRGYVITRHDLAQHGAH
jgi:DNA polymerase-3 subunit chi